MILKTHGWMGAALLLLTVSPLYAGETNAEPAQNIELPPLEYPVASFGAAILGDSVFVYGGHTGRAHEYYHEAQERTLRRLDLSDPQEWQELAEGPGLQGLAMVAHGNRVIRIGGFTAKNRDGEPHDLWSQAEVAAFDLDAKQWTEMPPLPEPRSSFDAAVLGDTLYVVGGWNMQGGKTDWHTTAYALDLSKEAPRWQPLAEPPFQRRALSVAAHDGKIYAIGGMQSSGGPTTRVDVYDPQSNQWSEGPSLIGEGMDGFGSAAFAVGGSLYVSTLSGQLQRLADDGQSWEVVRELDPPRFFHRMLPVGDDQLLFIGGANMAEGKYEALELIQAE